VTTPASSPVAGLTSLLRHRGVQATLVLWAAGYGVVLMLAHGSLPFDRPAVAQLSFAAQLAVPSLGLIEIFVLMAIIFAMTGKRVIPDIAARAPASHRALIETLMVLGYAALGQVGGWILGPALGYRPFSFHIAGTVFGCSIPPHPGEIWTWAVYNFVVFAAVPYLVFRRRYSNTELNLRSIDRMGDLKLIAVVCVIDVRAGRPQPFHPATDPAPAAHRRAAQLLHLLHRHGPADHGADLFDPLAALPETHRVDGQHRASGRPDLRRHAYR